MHSILFLQRGWKDNLADLVSSADSELVISSPYITSAGTVFLARYLTEQFRTGGRITVLTDLSPLNVMQGATEPNALESLAVNVNELVVWHLPRLHAKVYVADSTQAIVTSGNLTAGGLSINYEYGVGIANPRSARAIRRDILAYAHLGAAISIEQLIAYGHVAEDVRRSFKRQQSSIAKSLRLEFEQTLHRAEDDLIRLRLARSSIHSIFAKTILYLLNHYDSMTTEQLHSMIKAIHPDLCDDTVDRVIDGKRFGKKWKHAVRTAQQHLKRKGLIALNGELWMSTKKLT